MIKASRGYLYRITAKKLNINDNSFYTFLLNSKANDAHNESRFIRYLNEKEIRKEFDESVFGIANLRRYYSNEVSTALSRNNPILIYGEVGVGKNHLAQTFYLLNSKFIKNPFIIVDFSRINQRLWDRLISREDSPLYDNGNTLFLKNIDAIDNSMIRRLITALIDSDTKKRNRLILSCSSQRGIGNQSSVSVLKLVNQLDCLVVNMLPLRDQYSTIESSVNLLLDDFRLNKNPNVGTVNADAMLQLTHYSWPQNYDQLIRVVEKLGTLAGNGPITSEIVSTTLTKEISMTQGETGTTSNTILDLTKSLEDINRDIAKLILEQNGDNQSAAARSLGISRTTLWRMLKDHDISI
jgi:DNA-binding NtrC family response regulator